MTSFEISEDFLLNGEPFKIMSGAIHYFRVHPSDWYHSLYNLKSLGFNTVETYVPWNMHEPQKNEFNFNGILDIEKFLSIAKDLDLYAIVRPSPFICAEWEFGGLPAWLLKVKTMRIRSDDSLYLSHVADYYKVLLGKLKKHQLHQGGNILMFQVENEYGSFDEDKDYLRALKSLIIDNNISMPLFTSDGPWLETQRAGSLIEDDILSTGNFGSKARENFKDMSLFFESHNKKWPLMCMEFWDGWFNRWGEKVVKRDPDELAESVKEVLELGSINLYMFHGGTNFGFMNGCSARGEIDLPQVTSYDYDAILDEAGNPTPKYYALKKMLNSSFPELVQTSPLIKSTLSEQDIVLTDKVNLFNVLETISNKQDSKYPKSMEQLNQNTGYTLYRTYIDRGAKAEEFFRIIDGRDRIHFFVNEKMEAIQYQTEIGANIVAELPHEMNQIDILVENMGRVNYGSKLLAETQRKGIRRGVMSDLHFIINWEQYPLTFDDISMIDFSMEDFKEGQPSFYRYTLEVDAPQDTYIDLTGFGKGIVFMNGFNLGRFWEIGPYHSLYVPHGLLIEGMNEIIIFETEGKYKESLRLTTQHVIDEIEEEN